MITLGTGAAEWEAGDLLAIYLRDHYAASPGGLDLFARAARSQSDAEVARELRQLTAEIAEDRAALLGILTALGIKRSPAMERLVSWAETLGRLKPNASFLRRSPLSDVVELEALTVAVQAKTLGWTCLLQLAESDARLSPDQLDDLVRRARAQQERLDSLRLATARKVFGPGATGPGSLRDTGTER